MIVEVLQPHGFCMGVRAAVEKASRTLSLSSGKAVYCLHELVHNEQGVAELAARLSHAPDYFEVAKRAIDEMLRQVGPCRPGPDGMLQKGVIIRHLILPGQVQNSLKVLDYVAERFPPGTVLLSLMAQYVPAGRVKRTPPFDRTVTAEEYDAVVSWLHMLGLEDGFLQEPDAATEEYLPDFSLEGIL